MGGWKDDITGGRKSGKWYRGSKRQEQLEERLVAPFVQRRLSLTIVILETHSYIFFSVCEYPLCFDILNIAF